MFRKEREGKRIRRGRGGGGNECIFKLKHKIPKNSAQMIGLNLSDCLQSEHILITATQMVYILRDHSIFHVENTCKGSQEWTQGDLLHVDIQVRDHRILDRGGCGEG